MKYHFIHIGKTGGTSIKMAMRDAGFRIGETDIAVYDHDITMRAVVELRPEDKVFFVIRDPISLLISGFNSRLRQGLPRHHRPWSRFEAVFFERFPEVSDFVTALLDTEHPDYSVAMLGMSNSIHIGRRLSFYLNSNRFLKRTADHIGFILRQKNLNDDFKTFVAQLGGDTSEISLPADDIGMHKSPETVSKRIPDGAEAELRKFFRAEYAIYDTCHEIAEAQGFWGKTSEIVPATQ